MVKSPSMEVLSAMVSLRNNHNWSRIFDYLKERRDEQGYATCMATGAEAINVGQGRFRELNDLIELVDSAEHRLKYVTPDKE